MFGQKGKEEEEEEEEEEEKEKEKEEEEEEVLDEDGSPVCDRKKGYYGSLLCVIPAAEQFLQSTMMFDFWFAKRRRRRSSSSRSRSASWC